mgnify:CR=1 FL=1
MSTEVPLTVIWYSLVMILLLGSFKYSPNPCAYSEILESSLFSEVFELAERLKKSLTSWGIEWGVENPKPFLLV